MPQATYATLLWLIPVLPLAGFLVLGLSSMLGARSERGPERGLVAALAVLFPVLAFVVTLICAGAIAGGGTTQLRASGWEWFDLGGVEIGFGLLFDRLSALMLAFITGIGSLIVLYSTAYMREDRGYARFLAYLNLFLFNMIVLVLADNLLLTFLGWEGVGLCSYLLIGFWYRDHVNNDAARKAFIVNRVGDLGFLLGAFCLLACMGEAASLDYTDIRAYFGSGLAVATPLLTGAALLLFLGATGKSAQLPLMTWLPDAMAGPTPVSALIHAATMVTAGVFLLARLGPVFETAGAAVQLTVGVVALATALWAAIAGLFQWDIKKILAYSTISQLGFMFMACAVGAYNVALFHVFTHAFFKAALFLGAGSVITALHHEQDIRRMGGLAKRLRHTHGAMLLAWWSIIGMPLGAAFFSKDLILEKLHEAQLPGATVIWILALAAAGITAVYMTRFMCYVFWSPSRVDGHHVHEVREPSPLMVGVVVLLAIGGLCAGALWIGFINYEMVYRQTALDGGVAMAPFAAWLAPVLGAELQPHAEAGNWIIGHALPGVAMSVGLATAGTVLAWFWYRKGPRVAPGPLAPPRGFAAAWTWFLDRIYDALLVRPLVAFGRFCSAIVERLLIGGFNDLVGGVVAFFGSGFQSFQRSRLRISLAISLVMVVAVLLLLVSGLQGSSP